MSDLWSFPSSSPPPIMQHSLSQSSPFMSSPPPLSSPLSPGNHGNPPHTKVSSYNVTPQTQVSSPHLPEHHVPPPQVNSPHIVPETQVSSSHLLYQPQDTSPHCAPWSQVTSPHLHHSQVTSPHLHHSQVTSPHLHHSQVTSPHLHHSQVTSPHLPHSQVTSPHLHHSQVTSPHLPHSQVTSPHLHHSQVNSPHLHHSQVTSPHLHHSQVTSPHLHHSQVTSPHLHHSQVTSPHLPPQTQVPSSPLTHVTSSHFPHPYVTSPHLVPQVTSPHLISPPQHHLSNQSPDPGVDPHWSRSEPPEVSNLLRSYGYSYQNQNAAHLDPHLQNQNQNQNQFSAGVTPHRDEVESTHRPSYNNHTLLCSGVYDQSDSPGPVQDTWRTLGPTLSQLQCSPLGSTSGDVALGRWSSVEFSSSPAEDSSGTHFFHDSCHDISALQPFCSPNTPGLSPHYPQTPTISSPGPQMHPREDRPDYQTSRQPSRDKTLSSCLHESDGYPVTSDPGQHHPHQTGQHLLQNQSELIRDQSGLLDAAANPESQDARSPDLAAAGLSWREEAGGRGRRRGRGGGGGRGGKGQTDWSWVKQAGPKSSSEPADSRLLCTVCKRDFRSLPALNGHMRSHSGSRSAAWFNKDDDSSPSAPPSVSMVMPVTVPVQSRASAKACRSGQRRCSRLAPVAAHATLYRSLMRPQEEQEEGVHYTPPPMLCPLRAGPGLYCSVTTRGQQTHNGPSDLVAMETASPPPATLTGNNKARINVGRDFQAEIPPLGSPNYAHIDSHNALLLWTPWDELERPVNQQRVEALLTMARSSVVPGGGASPETALHVLSECRGNFLRTLEKLLSTPETSDNNVTAQQDPSVSWSTAERRSLVKSLQLHHKDFRQIQKAVHTKSLSQCVEFYYLWKKKLGLSSRTPAGLTITLPDSNGQRSSR